MAVEEEGPVFYDLKPWDNALVKNDPWHLQEWKVDVKAGHFVMCQNTIKRNTDTKQWEKHGPRVDRLEGFAAQFILSRDDMDRVYNISAEHDIKLLEALIAYKGENSFAPAYLEAIENCPDYRAHKKYAPQKVEVPDFINKKAKSKKAAKKKSAPKKSSAPVGVGGGTSIGDVVRERLGNPEE